MAIERNTPQLVKKGKGKKRPGYRGGDAYGRSSRSSGPAGGASAGGNYGGNRNPSQSYGGSTRPNPHRKSGTSKTSTVSGDKMRSSAREWEQQLNHNNARRAAQTGQKFTPYKGGSRPKGGISGLGNLIMSGLGALMGIPGLGFLTGGLDRLKGGLGSLNETLGDFREKTTGFRTQKEWEDARTQRQLQSRLDNLYDRKAKGKGFSQKNIDMLESQYGLSPSTAQNVLTGRDLKGFTPSRMGLQTQITPMAKPTFSDPFANTVGTTANTINDAVSSNSIPTVNGVPMIDTGSVYQDNLEFFDNLNKGIVKNNNTPMLNTDNLLQGSVIDQQPKKGIMQMISDAIFSPAGAAEIDFSKLSQAQDKFEPSYPAFYDKNSSFQGNKYTGTTKSDFVDFLAGGKFGLKTEDMFNKNINNLFKGVADNEIGTGFTDDATPTYVRTGTGTDYTGYIDVPQTALGEKELGMLPGGFFKARGGRVGYANGGLASLFTRRG